METIILRGEYIKLGQALKAAGMVESGVEAKEVIQEGLVMVNGETDTRRGRKLYGGDIVLFGGEEWYQLSDRHAPEEEQSERDCDKQDADPESK